MIEPKFIELMNLELDGAISERDRAALHEILSGNPEAAEYYEGLRATFATISTVEPADPPAELLKRTLEAIPFARRHGRETTQGELTSRLQRWFAMPRLRYAAVFAVGIAFGIVAYATVDYGTWLQGGKLDTSDFVGTMKHGTTSTRFEQTASLDVELDPVRGAIKLHESGDILLADVALDATGKIEWAFQFDPKDMSLYGHRSDDGGAGDLVAGPAQVRVRQTGETRYLLFFNRKGDTVPPLLVKIYSADRLLLERTLAPARDL